jgi:hypothetical protein
MNFSPHPLGFLSVKLSSSFPSRSDTTSTTSRVALASART